MGQYSHAHKARQATGDAPKKQENNSMTIDGPNVIDESGDSFPKVPPKPSPQVPSDDSFKKWRTEQA